MKDIKVTATSKPTSTTAARSIPGFLAGRDLAVNMIRELQAEGPDACSIERESFSYSGEAISLDGEQSTTMQRYLRQVAERPDLMAGFAALLTDLIGSDGTADIEHLSGLGAREMGQRKASAKRSSRHVAG